jgi:hypothetical protein
MSHIKAELEQAVARRSALWHELSEGGHDPAKSAEAAALSEQIDALWAEARALKARDLWGDTDVIRARARAEERLERDSRRLKAA